MRVIFAALILSVSFLSINANGQQYRGVHDILTTEDMTDMHFTSAVMQRCSGLYTSIAVYSKSIPQQLKEASMLNAVKGSRMATKMLNQKINNPAANKQKVEELIRTYTSIYYKKLETSQTLTGSIFSEWIKLEFKDCNDLFAKF